jgi:hypothetical protein
MKEKLDEHFARLSNVVRWRICYSERKCYVDRVRH